MTQQQISTQKLVLAAIPKLLFESVLELESKKGLSHLSVNQVVQSMLENRIPKFKQDYIGGTLLIWRFKDGHESEVDGVKLIKVTETQMEWLKCNQLWLKESCNINVSISTILGGLVASCIPHALDNCKDGFGDANLDSGIRVPRPGSNGRILDLSFRGKFLRTRVVGPQDVLV